MYIRNKRPWDVDSSEPTPERIYFERRRFISRAVRYGVMGGLVLTGMGGFIEAAGALPWGRRPPLIEIPRTPTSGLYPARRNKRFILDRPQTKEAVAAAYNNFYEFSSKKNVWEHVGGFMARPWTIEITGLVRRPKVYDIDALIRRMSLEERLYRHRCVEAWAMAVPWTGFPLRDLIKLAGPLSSAKYVKFQSLQNSSVFPGQLKRFWQPWPYEEGLTMEEAMNELTLIATGIYGHELPAQHGSPIRLVIPWKYGFKSIKSIVRIEFTETRPKTFWNTLAPDEYGFQSNVDPTVPHPRWSQATERMIGTGQRVPTLKYNGYGEYVTKLYEG